MKDKLVMRLFIEGLSDNTPTGYDTQRIEAELSPDSRSLINRQITGIPVVSGTRHIHPEAIKDVKTAYETLESIRREFPDKEATIEIKYT